MILATTLVVAWIVIGHPEESAVPSNPPPPHRAVARGELSRPVSSPVRARGASRENSSSPVSRSVGMLENASDASRKAPTDSSTSSPFTRLTAIARSDSLAARARLAAPALSVEVPDSPWLTQHGQLALQSFAEQWHAETALLPGEPGTPAFDARWIDAVDAADFALRQRFGKHAWLQHHIQAHHLLGNSGGDHPR